MKVYDEEIVLVKFRLVPSTYLVSAKRLRNHFIFLIHCTHNTGLHMGAICQFLVYWIYYCHSSKSTGKKADKLHLCALHTAYLGTIRKKIESSFYGLKLFLMS